MLSIYGLTGAVGLRHAVTNIVAVMSCETIQKAFVHHHKERYDLERFIGIKRSNPARANRNTAINERRFRRLRGAKTVVIELPDDVERRKQEMMSPAELRIAMLKKGLNPYKEVQPRSWNEGQITLQSFYGVIDPYVAPEEPLPFVVPSALTDSVKSKGQEIKERALHLWHNYKNGRSRIRKKEGFEKFDPKLFGATADSIYVEAHKALMARDKVLLHKYITEHAFVKMWPDVENGSVVWEMVEQKEPSRVVAIRCSDSPYKSGNDIAQLTVRMHTVQKLAIYDKFGRLILGSEVEPKIAVEYVVFENHIASLDGAWRLHDKVYPRWIQPKQPARITGALEDLSEASRPSMTQSLPLRAEILDRERRERKRLGKEDEEER
uniref:Large ribosomal subunit protein mL45 n=1 Tax=Parascaris univalens TaxID=6257 RepID=A0A915BE17_PARUN